MATVVSDAAPADVAPLEEIDGSLADMFLGEDVPWPLISAASLSSLVLHISVLVVLASLTFPPRENANPAGDVTLDVSLTTHVHDENRGDLVRVELEDQPNDGESLDEAGDDVEDDAGATQVEPESVEPTPEEPEDSLDEAAPVELPGPAPPAVDVVTEDPMPEFNLAAEQAPNSPAGVLPDTEADPEFDGWLAKHVRADSPGDEGVVNRFILYDIGRLNGAAGERARREFNQLGPQNVPALLEGLNKSASINASCPVLVISYKLATQLGKIEDPQLLKYATENIGRDVPEDAPHWSRIRQMQRLSAELQSKLQRRSSAPAEE